MAFDDGLKKNRHQRELMPALEYSLKICLLILA